jgi:hypothetical protein
MSRPPQSWNDRRAAMRGQLRRLAHLAKRWMHRSGSPGPPRPGPADWLRAHLPLRREVRIQRAVRAQNRTSLTKTPPVLVGTRGRILGSLAGLIVVGGTGAVLLLGGHESRAEGDVTIGPTPSSVTSPSPTPIPTTTVAKTSTPDPHAERPPKEPSTARSTVPTHGTGGTGGSGHSPSPTHSHSPSPAPSPSPSPAPSPSPSPEPSPSPSPSPSPEPSPSPSA